MSLPTRAVKDSLSYLAANPLYLLRATRNAARLRLSVPLDVLRWLVERRPAGKGPERIDVSSRPPGLGVDLTVDLFGTKLDVSSTVVIESVEAFVDALKVSLRVSDLAIKAPPGTPAAMMVQALDLKRPGSLMGMMPKRPAALVDARDDLFVFDLLKVPALGQNPLFRRALNALGEVVAVREVCTDNDLVLVGLSINPLGLPSALARLRD